MTRFEPVVANTDLDIHPDPSGLWSRVAVISLWQDAKIARKRWPHAAVVGPLRTKRGLDELVRNLLANPAIRIVVVDGKDLSADGDTLPALKRLWASKTPAEQLYMLGWLDRLDTNGSSPTFNAAFDALFADVKLVDATNWGDRSSEALTWMGLNADEWIDRSEKHVLPPPPPKPSDDWPHGDPGQQVHGDTLADVWPRVLEQAHRFGRKVQTQYGESREVLCLTSVIRQPYAYMTGASVPGGTIAAVEKHIVEHGGTLAEAQAAIEREMVHPVLGISSAQVDAYYKKLTTWHDDSGATEYSYGSRMRGKYTGQGVVVIPDQIEAVHKLLTDSPSTRAAYMTPWRPDEDGGKESGRPCLVSVYFRAVGGGHEAPVPGREAGDPDYCPRCGFEVGQPGDTRNCDGNPRVLHMIVAFRSHDLFAAYPLNLAAACRWLVDEAVALGMAVGTLTCTSFSAHIYARDYDAARAVFERWRGPVIDFDPRSHWRIRTAETEEPVEGLRCQRKVGEDHTTMPIYCGKPAVVQLRPIAHQRWRCADHDDDPDLRMPLPRKRKIVAEAYAPEGDRLLAVFEGETASVVSLQIARSGLVSSASHGLYLGRELEKAEREVGGGP